MKYLKREGSLLISYWIRIHLIIVMIWWTGLAPWEIEFPFPGSLISTFLDPKRSCGSISSEELRALQVTSPPVEKVEELTVVESGRQQARNSQGK